MPVSAKAGQHNHKEKKMTPMDTKPLSPSERPLTRPQANKLGEALTAAVLKVNPFSDEAQDLIENFWNEVKAEVEAANVEALNRVLDRKRNTITIRVRVKRGRPGKQVFTDTGRVPCIIDSVAASAPLIPGDDYEEVDFVFFKGARRMRNSQVEVERHKRGLVRDLEAQAQANADHPAFADEHPNGDSWQDSDGNWRCAYFNRRSDRNRYVSVGRCSVDWGDHYWIGGVAPKLPLAA